MTTSVCLNCGAIKGPSWLQCTSCGFDPATEMEFAYSMAFSDHYFSPAQLREIGSVIAGGAVPALGGKPEAALLDAVKAPMIQGIRTAKILQKLSIETPKGWLNKTTTAIVLGPHGHRASRARVGKDIDKAEYQRFKDGRGFIYVIERSENGQSNWEVVSEQVWLEAHDIYIARMRQEAPISMLLKHINSAHRAS